MRFFAFASHSLTHSLTFKDLIPLLFLSINMKASNVGMLELTPFS